MTANAASSAPVISSLYKASIHRLLQYVGLTGYGTPQARMPLRSAEEENAIRSHYDAAYEDHVKHVASLKARGLHFERQMRLSVQEAMESCVRSCEADENKTEKTTACSSPSSSENPAEASERLSSPGSRVASSSSSSKRLPTIFMSFEESIEWKAFLRSIPPRDRHRATVKRALSLLLWTAHQKHLCMYCWLPIAMCVCEEIEKYAVQMRHVLADTFHHHGHHSTKELRAGESSESACEADMMVKVTMLLHVEEVLRGTNTGHLAAFILDAPLIVWGVSEDDAFIQTLSPVVRTSAPGGPHQHWTNQSKFALHPSTGSPSLAEPEGRENQGGSAAAAAAVPTTTPEDHDASATNHHDHNQHTKEWYSVCLYPSSGAPTFPDFVEKRLFHVGENSTATTPTFSSATNETDHGEQGEDILDDDTAVSPSMQHTQTPLSFLRRVHLILLDSTWGQALSLNRHIPKRIPRVALTIEEDYEALFASLRKRTRASGVSTLEATGMAIHQCLEALGLPHAAALSTRCLREAMMSYVNLKCILKCAEVPFHQVGTDIPVKDGDHPKQPFQTSEKKNVERKKPLFTEDPHVAPPPSRPLTIEELRVKRDDARREADLRRYDNTQRRVHREHGALRDLLLPPVLNYCYLCDRVIGWHRMPEHVQGQAHRRLWNEWLAQQHRDGSGPNHKGDGLGARIIPSDFSSTVVVQNFERHWRRNGQNSKPAAAGQGDDE